MQIILTLDNSLPLLLPALSNHNIYVKTGSSAFWKLQPHNTVQHATTSPQQLSYKHITKPSHLSTCLLQTPYLEFQASALLFQTFIHGFCTVYLLAALQRILWLTSLILCKWNEHRKDMHACSDVGAFSRTHKKLEHYTLPASNRAPMYPSLLLCLKFKFAQANIKSRSWWKQDTQWVCIFLLGEDKEDPTVNILKTW